MRRPGFSQTIVPTAVQSIKKKKQLGRAYYYYLLLKQAWPLLIFVPFCLFLGIYLFRDTVIPYLTQHVKIKNFGTSVNQGSTLDTAPVPKKGAVAQRYELFSPTYGFVMFESYRTGAKSFAVIGLSGVVFRGKKKLGQCLWKESGGGHRARGKIIPFFPGEHHDLKYEVIILTCQLDDSTEHDTGGKLLMQIDGEEIVVYEEASGAFPVAEPKAPFKHRVAFCSPPLVQPVHPQRLYEWIEYHSQQGVDFMTFYDAGGLEEDAAALLEKYVAKGLAEIVNMRKIAEFEAWDNGHVLSKNDCAYRMRYKAKWAFSSELSEYFASEKGLALSSLLDTYAGKPYVSFGSRWWSLEKCLPDEADKLWGVERLVYHWPHVYCSDKEQFPRWEMCLDYFGFRRYAVDPRQAIALQIHRPEIPKSGGADVDTDVARMNRWPNLIEKRSKFCSHVVQPSEVVDWWTHDKSLVPSVQTAKQSPIVTYKVKK